MLSDWERLAVHYTSGQDNEYFGWHDARHDNVKQLAQRFTERFPEVLEASHGEDWTYAGWYVRMLGYAENGHVPVAYDDRYSEDPQLRFLPLLGTESDLPMPPPGDADDSKTQ